MPVDEQDKKPLSAAEEVELLIHLRGYRRNDKGELELTGPQLISHEALVGLIAGSFNAR